MTCPSELVSLRICEDVFNVSFVKHLCVWDIVFVSDAKILSQASKMELVELPRIVTIKCLVLSKRSEGSTVALQTFNFVLPRMPLLLSSSSALTSPLLSVCATSEEYMRPVFLSL